MSKMDVDTHLSPNGFSKQDMWLSLLPCEHFIMIKKNVNGSILIWASSQECGISTLTFHGDLESLP